MHHSKSLKVRFVCVHTLCFGFVTANKHETTTCKRLLGSTFFLHLHKSDVFRLDFGVAFMSHYNILSAFSLQYKSHL